MKYVITAPLEKVYQTIEKLINDVENSEDDFYRSSYIDEAQICHELSILSSKYTFYNIWNYTFKINKTQPIECTIIEEIEFQDFKWAGLYLMEDVEYIVQELCSEINKICWCLEKPIYYKETEDDFLATIEKYENF